VVLTAWSRSSEATVEGRSGDSDNQSGVPSGFLARAGTPVACRGSTGSWIGSSCSATAWSRASRVLPPRSTCSLRAAAPGRHEQMNGSRRIDAVLAWCSEVVRRFDAVPVIRDGPLNWRRAGDRDFRILAQRQDDDTVALFSVAQELEASPRYKKAEDAIRDDAVIGPLLGKIVGDAYTQIALTPEEVLFGFVLAVARQPDAMRAAVRARLDDVRKALSASTRPRRIIAPLPAGFVAEIQHGIELDDRSSLVRLDDADIATVLEAGLRFQDGEDASGLAFVGTPWAIVVAFDVPVVAHDPGQDVPDGVRTVATEATEDATARVVRAVHALRLTKEGPISTVGMLQMSDDRVLTGRTVTSSSARRARPLIDSYVLEEDDVGTLRWLVGQLGDPSVTSSRALQTAIRRLSSSTEHHDVEDRLIDLVMSAEALFADDERSGDLAVHVAQRFARFVAPAAKRSAMDLFGHMKQQYAGRNAIVHAKRRTPKSQRKIDRAVRDIDQTERLLRMALRRALGETVQSGAFAVPWDRLVLEGKSRGSVITLHDATQPVG
jgi:hypothetical protein